MEKCPSLGTALQTSNKTYKLYLLHLNDQEIGHMREAALTFQLLESSLK